MLLHKRSLALEVLKNHDGDAPVTIAELRVMFDYLEETRRAIYRYREDIISHIDYQARKWWYIDENYVTRTEIEELIRERIQPLNVAVFGKSLKHFDPAHFENMG